MVESMFQNVLACVFVNWLSGKVYFSSAMSTYSKKLKVFYLWKAIGKI